MIPYTKKVLESGVLVDRPLYHLRNIADKSVVKEETLSNTLFPNPPNPGVGQEYLPIVTEDPVPDFDPVFSTRTADRSSNEVDHQREIHYIIADRPVADQLQAIANARRLETSKQFPTQDANDAIILTLAALLRLAKGLELTPIEQTYADKVVAVAAILQSNADHEADLKEIAQAGGKPDLTIGWEPIAALDVPILP